MALSFPPKGDRPDGLLYPVPESDIILQWHELTNSWNIVGPDNLATTDYVDQTIATDATKTARNSALHATTNVINIETIRTATVNTTCQNAATSSFAGDLQYAPGGDFQLDPESWNDAAYLHATKGTLPEWAACNDNMRNAAFTFIGHDLTKATNSSEFQYILGISISTSEKDGTAAEFGKVVPGDIIEVYYDATTRAAGADGVTAIKFALYEVIDVYEGANTIAFGVIFRESNTPTESILVEFPYELVTYGATLGKTGGDVNGDFQVVSDSAQAFSVWRNLDEKQYENPYNLVFNVDTDSNNITINEQYNAKFEIEPGSTQRDMDPFSLATIGYVSSRLGLSQDIRTQNEDGPYLRVVGGDVGSEIGLKVTNSAQGGAQNFVIRGVIDTPADGSDVIFSTLNNTSNDNKTEINYYGPSDRGSNITTVDWVNGRLSEEKPDLDVFLKKDGSVKLTDYLEFDNTSMHDGDIGSYKDNQLVAAKAVKRIKAATVLNGYTDEAGQLFQQNGALYYNVYP